MSATCVYLLEVSEQSKRKYKKLYKLKSRASTQKQIELTSLNVAGWATCVVQDYDRSDEERDEAGDAWTLKVNKNNKSTRKKWRTPCFE